ncbi:uncharacterized protein LOC119405216 isoform X2 [Rhipicephalus sanguineus]|uniref:uncharacterized protein LOC119405216 isoform X2 n=1 Tax=Rhipicephalus sanguineus TaxID=34632 RepID=UPI0020C4F1B4|nr:uncharacterized protein LOC119405216 isoform X2 [Rhipicephalus sanguineus]
MAEDRNGLNTPPALSSIDTSPAIESSDEDSPFPLDLYRTSDGTWNVDWTLQDSLAFSTPWYYGHSDTTDNASMAFQPPMSSASVVDFIPSTSHGVKQETPDLPGNDDRLYMLLPPTEMREIAGTSLFKKTGGSNNISVLSTSSAPIQQHNARFLGLTNDVPLNTAHDTIATTSGKYVGRDGRTLA